MAPTMAWLTMEKQGIVGASTPHKPLHSLNDVLPRGLLSRIGAVISENNDILRLVLITFCSK